MLEVQVYDMQGNEVEKLQVDQEVFGGEVNTSLLKQAIVAYHTNTHQGSAANKSRGMVAGSTRKLFRQKGTGNARRGPRRTPVVKGGGVTFAKRPYRVRHAMNRKMKRKALNSAILAKLLGEDLMVVKDLKLDAPKTKTMAQMFAGLKIDRSCLLALAGQDEAVYLSTRNLPKTAVMTVADLNAYEVAKRVKMVVSREAMDLLLEGGK
jgi:large subunit ribosomal protein L4